MAPYRQGDAGKGAALDADSDVEPDQDDQSSAWSFDSPDAEIICAGVANYGVLSVLKCVAV